MKDNDDDNWLSDACIDHKFRDVELPVKLHRHRAFENAVRFVTSGLLSGGYAPLSTIDKDATEGVVELWSSSRARPGTGNGVVSGASSSFTQNSAALPVTVRQPERST